MQKSCKTCNMFFSEEDDFNNNFGVCLNNVVFKPFINFIFETYNFSSCINIYNENRYNGVKKCCEKYIENCFLDFNQDFIDNDKISDLIFKDLINIPIIDLINVFKINEEKDMLINILKLKISENKEELNEDLFEEILKLNQNEIIKDDLFEEIKELFEICLTQSLIR